MRKSSNAPGSDPNLSMKRRHAVNKRRKACFVLSFIIGLGILSALKLLWPINDYKPVPKGMGLPNEIAVEDDDFEPKKPRFIDIAEESQKEEEQEQEQEQGGAEVEEAESHDDAEEVKEEVKAEDLEEKGEVDDVNENGTGGDSQTESTFDPINQKISSAESNSFDAFSDRNASKIMSPTLRNISNPSDHLQTATKDISNPKKRSIIEVAESNDCKVPRPIKECRLKRGERIHVIFVSAMWYREPFTQVETENIIKSILFQTRCPLFLHFLVAGEPETISIPKMMKKMDAIYIQSIPPPLLESSKNLVSDGSSNHTVDSTGDYGYYNLTSGDSHPVLYSMHFIPAGWVVKRAKNLFLYPLAHHAGIPGMAKFFMADILYQVNRALYLDVDMIFAGDVQDMWDYFKTFDENKDLLYYMSNNHPEGHNKRRLLRPYCSCQMVMDLKRMRKANLTNILIEILNGTKPKSLKEYVEDGDQWLFMWVCKQLSKVCRILPRMWNVSGCSKPVPFLGLNSRGKEANGTCWRIVHFNCMGHVRGGKGSYKMPEDWSEASKWVKKLRLERLKESWNVM